MPAGALQLLVPLVLLLGLTPCLTGCRTEPNDDDSSSDDDDTGPDDDDSLTDDDDTGPDDDDSSPDDDDTEPDDDDTGPDDDDTEPDDDDSAPCVEDAWEENDDLASAAPGLVIQGLTPDLAVCSASDEDWFVLDLVAGEVASVGLLFDSDEGDLELELVDGAGVSLAVGQPVDEGVLAWTEIEVTGAHYARVRLLADGGAQVGVPYSIGAKLCVDDPYEDNDDLASAAELTLPISLFDLGTCRPGEEDWFVLSGVNVGDLLDIRLVFRDDDGDIDATLFDPDGVQVATGTNAAQLETIVHYALSSGDYVLRLWLATDDDGPGVFYDLDVYIVMFPDACEDPFDPNDDPSAAAPLTTAQYEDLSVCEDEPDWFAFDVNAGDTIVFWIDFPHAEGNVDLFVFDPSGAEVAAATSLDDDETATFVASTSGTYLALVELVDDGGWLDGVPYNLLLSGTSAVGCVPDLFEPNDSTATAWPLSNGDFSNQTICPTDDDWFELSLNQFELLELNLGTFHPLEGTIEATLYDAWLTEVASIPPLNSYDWVFYEVTSTGTYYLQISLVSDAGTIDGQIYDFGVVSIIQVGCSPDLWEQNDSLGSAAPITVGDVSGAVVCDTDPDFYSFSVTSGATVTVDVAFDPADGELDVVMYDELGVVVANSVASVDGRSVEAVATVDETWAVQVYMVADAGSEGSTYDLELAVTP